MITIVLCQYLLIGSAREDYIKKQGELYFGITLLIWSSDRETVADETIASVRARISAGIL